MDNQKLNKSFFFFFYSEITCKCWWDVKVFLGHHPSHCKLLKDYIVFHCVVFVILSSQFCYKAYMKMWVCSNTVDILGITWSITQVCVCLYTVLSIRNAMWIWVNAENRWIRTHVHTSTLKYLLAASVYHLCVMRWVIPVYIWCYDFLSNFK